MITYYTYNVVNIIMAVTFNLIIIDGTLLEDFYNQINSNECHSILWSLDKGKNQFIAKPGELY